MTSKANKGVSRAGTGAVKAAYKAVLGREPDAEGLATYRGRLSHPGGLAGMLTDLVGSEEFRNRVFAEMAPELVRAAYMGMLGREPEEEALASYSGTLAGTRDLPAMLAEISRSDEFRRLVLVAGPSGRDHAQYTVRDLEERKLVFMHHPKTGGTTLHHILVGSFGEDAVCPERFNGLHRYPAGELARYRFFSGHFDLPSVRLIPGRKAVVTMLREPVARLVSMYYFLRAHNPDIIEKYGLDLARLANEHDMAGFFGSPEVRRNPAVNNSMTRTLTDVVDGYRWESDAACILPDAEPLLPLARRELDSLDAFGIMERYDDSVELICRSLGLETPSSIEPRQVLDVIMDNEPGLRRIEKEPVTDEVRGLVAGLVQTDIKLYLHACSVFEVRMREMRRGKAVASGRRPEPAMRVFAPVF